VCVMCVCLGGGGQARSCLKAKMHVSAHHFDKAPINRIQNRHHIPTFECVHGHPLSKHNLLLETTKWNCVCVRVYVCMCTCFLFIKNIYILQKTTTKVYSVCVRVCVNFSLLKTLSYPDKTTPTIVFVCVCACVRVLLRACVLVSLKKKQSSPDNFLNKFIVCACMYLCVRTCLPIGPPSTFLPNAASF
jgi:hypothetical protein